MDTDARVMKRRRGRSARRWAEPKGETIMARIPGGLLADLDAQVEDGEFGSRSEAIRMALELFLYRGIRPPTWRRLEKLLEAGVAPSVDRLVAGLLDRYGRELAG